MALSTIAQPFPNLNPVFNPLKYILDSTNKNQTGFRYVFDLYHAGTANKISEFKVLPRFGDGYGEKDISRILQSLVSVKFDPSNFPYDDADGSYVLYDLKVGEEYVVPVNYTANVTQNGLYVKITATHSFQVGDQVVIEQVDDGAANPGLEGLFTVVAITGTTDFTVNSLWSAITDATINGSVRYSDNRKTIFRDLVTYSSRAAFNGAMSFADFISYDEANYSIDSATSMLLTSFPDEGIRIKPEQFAWFNAWNAQDNSFDVYFQNSNGDEFSYSLGSTTDITQICVAGGDDLQGELITEAGTAPLIKDDTSYYDVWINEASQISKKYRFYIDRRCAINDYELYFMDRMGSVVSFPMMLKDKLTGNVTKTEYNKRVEGHVSSTKWRYYSYERGTTTVDHAVTETLELNSNYMTQAEINYFTELITSPFTWLKHNGVYQACIVQDTTYEQERENVKRLMRKTVRIKLSNQDIING